MSALKILPSQCVSFKQADGCNGSFLIFYK